MKQLEKVCQGEGTEGAVKEKGYRVNRGPKRA
jgi:hypothetical protein